MAADAPRPDPTLFLAAVHRLAVQAGRPGIYAGADPWPAFRSFCLDHGPEIAALQQARRIQTNEVGRAAVLLPALPAHRPLALVEVGASAGLNLLLDRFRYVYGGGRPLGDAASPVTVACEVRGPARPPLPATTPSVVHRIGIDLDPVDPGDPEAVAWLEACVWPDHPWRLARFRAALALAAADPAPVLAADAVEALPEVVAAVPDGAHVCVVTTSTLPYLPEARRAALARALAGLRRPWTWVSSEGAGLVPGLRPPPRRATSRGRSLLVAVVDRDGGRPVAWAHPHGCWLEWL